MEFARLLSMLADRGWATIQGVLTSDDLTVIAKMLGTPVRAPTGELVKILRPRTRDAPHRSFSAAYGLGAFPFHTDTAFWALPCRYVLMRVEGDTRRATLLLDFEEIFSRLTAHERQQVQRSVWRTGLGTAGMYCSMRFATKSRYGWRVDRHVMKPANDAARYLDRLVADRLAQPDRVASVPWAQTSCLVLDNWRILHARGLPPKNERERKLLRIYVH